jgi:hypothetical protein
LSHSYERKADGEIALVLTGEPNYIVALTMAPDELEPELRYGSWILLAFAIWSGPDRIAVGDAISLAKALAGGVRLGIRPFDDHAEFSRWCPQVNEKHASPIWLVLRDGLLIRERVGVIGSEQFEDLVRAASDRH